MSGEDAPLVRQGRPFDNAYCILSLFEKDRGIRITSYNSEKLTEAEMMVPWDDVVAAVGNVGPSTAVEKKRPLYDKLLSRVVLEVDPDGGTSLRLTRGAKKPVTAPLGSTAGSLGATSPSATRTLAPKSPAVTKTAPVSASPATLTSPIHVGGGAKTPKSKLPGMRSMRAGAASPMASPIKARKSPTKRRSPAFNASQSMASMGSLSTMRQTASPSKPVAGYKPPADLSIVDEEVVTQARRMMLPESKEKLKAFLAEPATGLAGESLGIDLASLRPRPVQVFRERPSESAQTVQLKHAHYERMRLENLALLLSERPTAEKRLLEERELKEAEELKLREGLYAALGREEKKLAHIDVMLKKIQDAGDREDELLRKRREQHRLHTEALEMKHKQLMERKAQQKQYLEHKGREKAEKIRQVQLAKERRRQQWMDEFDARNAEKERRLKRHKAILGDGKAERNARQRARAERRAQLLQENKDSIEARRLELTVTIQHKEGAAADLDRKRKEQLEQKRAERWMNMQTRLQNAERVRREREFQKKALLKKMQVEEQRLKALEDMKVAMQEERKAKEREARIKLDEWRKREFERHVTPGPGEYSLRDVTDRRGGALTKEEGLTMMEKLVKRGASMPGPAAYTDKRKSKATGGTMAKSTAPSIMDAVVKKAEELPGVGDYDAKPVEGTKGNGKFGDAAGASFTDQVIRHASSVPAPSDYGGTVVPEARPSLQDLKKRFTRAKSKLRAATHFMMRSERLVKDAFHADIDRKEKFRDSLGAAAAASATQ